MAADLPQNAMFGITTYTTCMECQRREYDRGDMYYYGDPDPVPEDECECKAKKFIFVPTGTPGWGLFEAPERKTGECSYEIYQKEIPLISEFVSVRGSIYEAQDRQRAYLGDFEGYELLCSIDMRSRDFESIEEHIDLLSDICRHRPDVTGNIGRAGELYKTHCIEWLKSLPKMIEEQRAQTDEITACPHFERRKKR